MAQSTLKFLIRACCLISFSFSHCHFLFAFPGIPLTPASCFPVKSAHKFDFLKPPFDLELDLSRRLTFLANNDWFSPYFLTHLISLLSHTSWIPSFFSHPYSSSPTVGLSANSTFPRSSTCICKLLPITSLKTSTFSLFRPSSTFWSGSYF